MLLFTDKGSFRRRESRSQLALPWQVSLRLGKCVARGDMGKELETEEQKHMEAILPLFSTSKVLKGFSVFRD